MLELSRRENKAAYSHLFKHNMEIILHKHGYWHNVYVVVLLKQRKANKIK